MSVVSTQKIANVLVVTSNNPPVNALGAAVRTGLFDAIEQANADTDIAAVVIIGAGRTFFAGADITEFDKPMADPGLPDVVDRIEASAKPVVAAIHGTALGGGLEVALGCHYRVAVPTAKFGLPEVKLGILPGAGGTQRLPRVVGIERALQMIVTGDPIGAADAQAIGLIDAVTGPDTLEADAIAFAQSVAGRNTHPVTSARPLAADPDAIALFRQKNARRLKGVDAPNACIEAIAAAATLPFEAGIAKERALFAQLVTGIQSQAQRHLFFAERAAAKVNGIPADTPLIPIRKVGILGAGTMGGGIAMNFLSVGIPVVLLEREQAPLDRGVAIIRRNYEGSAKRGRLTGMQVETAMSLLTPTLAYDDLADCDLVIEAVFELMSIKKEVFSKLDSIVKDGAILATNTSYLDVDEIAAITRRPESVIGLHFFSPANVMKLLEVVRGARTSETVLATCMALSKTIRKVAVVSGVCHGFIGNRMLEPRNRQAFALALEGVMPSRVDKVLLDFGWPMGPFQMFDLAGLDIGWDPDKSNGQDNLRDLLCEAGLFGQKVGHGFYDYDENRNSSPSAKVEAMITDFAARKGIVQRDIDDEEILERLLYPMVNEGALVLEEGIAQRASDIDVVWLYGYGWPAWKGGPMFWGDSVGLGEVVAGLERHKARITGLRISQLLVDTAAQGGKLTS